METKEKQFTDVTSIEECFEVAGRKPANSLAEIPEDLAPIMLALFKEIVVVEAANKLRAPNTKAEWTNTNQKKWFPWFSFRASGGVDYCGSDYGYSGADAGDASRLAFLDESDSRHAANVLPDVFEDFLKK